MSLYNLLPVEIVDMIYLRTDFFTAIKHIPFRERVLEILFNRDIHRVITKRNWGYGNLNHISIISILKRDCEVSLRYFKHKRPFVKLRDDMFKFDSECKIDRTLRWNSLLISVYRVDDYEIKYHESRHSRRFVHQLFSTI